MTTPKEGNQTGTNDQVVPVTTTMVKQGTTEITSTAEVPSVSSQAEQQVGAAQNIKAVSATIAGNAQEALTTVQSQPDQRNLTPEARKSLDQYLESVRDLQRYCSFELLRDGSVRVLVDTSVRPGNGRGGLRKTGEPSGIKESISFSKRPEDLFTIGMADAANFMTHQKAILEAYTGTMEVLPGGRYKLMDLSPEEMQSVKKMCEIEKIVASGSINDLTLVFSLDIEQGLCYSDPVRYFKEIEAKIPDQELAKYLIMFMFSKTGIGENAEAANYLERTYGPEFMDEAMDYSLRAAMHSGHNRVEFNNPTCVALLQRAAEIHKKYTIPYLATLGMDSIQSSVNLCRINKRPLGQSAVKRIENTKQLLIDVGCDASTIQQAMAPFSLT